MKKSVRTLIGASVAAVLGSTLLLGGAGTLAFWSDTTSSAAQAIQSGQLDLGSSADLTMTSPTIKQCTPTCNDKTPSASYAGGALVPGDVVTATVNVPVTLVGQNMKAKFAITPLRTAGDSSDPKIKAKNVAMASALSMTIVRVGPAKTPFQLASESNGAYSATLTPALLGTEKTVPVVVEIAFPWGTPGQYNDTMGGQVALSASYSLTQVAE